MARYRLFLYKEGVVVEPESQSLGKERKRCRGFQLEARTKVVEEQGVIVMLGILTLLPCLSPAGTGPLWKVLEDRPFFHWAEVF
jgi:hypothetical protein